MHRWLIKGYEPSTPTGPRAWILAVEIPTSAPNPKRYPSAKREEALWNTQAESTCFWKRSAVSRFSVTMTSTRQFNINYDKWNFASVFTCVRRSESMNMRNRFVEVLDNLNAAFLPKKIFIETIKIFFCHQQTNAPYSCFIDLARIIK